MAKKAICSQQAAVVCYSDPPYPHSHHSRSATIFRQSLVRLSPCNPFSFRWLIPPPGPIRLTIRVSLGFGGFELDWEAAMAIA
uniref:Uncharacterized protein n=1 Tax=Kalanchoe fedtschenkoi TaxID=63787 RepID=A0A7N0UGA1_KALFE